MAGAAQTSDGELLARHAAGDGEAFAGIVARHGPMVLAVCRRVVGGRPEAEDAAQAAFIALTRKAGGLADVGDLGAWLHRAAWLAARQALRAELRRQAHERAAAAMRPSISPDRAEEARKDWIPIRRRLDAALDRLPAAQRRVLVACYFEGLSQSEAASALGLPMGTVAVYCRRGLESLRKRLGAGRGALTSAAGLGSLLLAHAGDGGALPGGFMASTVAAAKGATAGSGALALAKGVVKAMFWTKVKTAATLLGAVAVLGVGVPATFAAISGGEPAKPETPAVKAGPRVTIDEQKRTCVDGKPFFPIGIYHVWPPEKLEEAKSLGFNTVHSYAGEGSKDKDTAKSPEEMRAYLDAADKLGLKVFMGLPRFQVVKGDAQRLEERVKLLRDHPALLAWYLFDEPHHQKVPAGAVQASADLIRKHDPNHPTVLVLCLIHERQKYHADHPEYVSLPDVLMTDRYPREPKKADLSPVAREIAVARRLVKDEKPIWTVVQLHGRGPGGAGYGLQEPDWIELRNMTYQALAAGAKGITSFAYAGSQFSLAKSPEGMKNARRITGELGALAPILLSDEPKAPPVAVGKADGVLSKVFVHDGKAYVIVVNLKNAEPVSVTVAPAPGGKLPAEAQVLFEDRPVKTADGKLTERIEANGVRVYELPLGGQ